MYRCLKIPKTLHIIPTHTIKNTCLVAGMDPGTRTFQTLYDNSNRVSFFGYEKPDNMDLFHKSVINYLIEEYTYVCLPKFNIKSYWNHALFYDMLYSTHNGLIEINEYLTSQICSNCGHINKCRNLYKCKCGLIMDRDSNAAKNILKRGLKLIS